MNASALIAESLLRRAFGGGLAARPFDVLLK